MNRIVEGLAVLGSSVAISAGVGVVAAEVAQVVDHGDITDIERCKPILEGLPDLILNSDFPLECRSMNHLLDRQFPGNWLASDFYLVNPGNEGLEEIVEDLGSPEHAANTRKKAIVICLSLGVLASSAYLWLTGTKRKEETSLSETSSST